MARMNSNFDELFEMDLVLPPDSYAASANASTRVDMTGYEYVTFIFMLGDSIANPVAVKLGEATAVTSGTTADLSGKTGTFTSDDDDTYGYIQVRASELSDGYPFVYATVTPDTAAAEVAVLAIRGVGKTVPESNSGATFSVT
jgi:hypothetical protein